MIDAESLIAETLRDETCKLLVLSRKRKCASTDLEKVSIRPVVVAGERCYQLTSQFPGKQTFENLDTPQMIERCRFLFEETFDDCHLFTITGDYSIRRQRRGMVKIKRKPPSKRDQTVEHNRTKQYLIPDDSPCPFLVEIGVMASNGKVKSAKYHKFRQINRFLELVNDSVQYLPAEGTLNVVDCGCGRSYLTFALHHLLTVIHKRRVHIIGLDRNADVIRESTHIAQRLNCRDLEFRVGDIVDHETSREIHLVVSLHACDTATDAAIARAIAWQVDVLLAVPCCQKELADMIHAEPFAPIHEHGILHERFAAIATDALRAKALEICGYKTQVVEFVDLEHTAKNVLIRAVRRPDSTPIQADLGKAYRRFQQALGLESSYLDGVLGNVFTDRLDL